MSLDLFEFRSNILYGSSLPITEEDVERIVEVGIRMVISLETSYPLPDFGKRGIEHHRMPVADYGTPDSTIIRRFIVTLRHAINDGRPVLVHCYGGCGRTGTMLALADIYLFGERDGLRAIRKVRSVRPCAIETPEQEKIVISHAAEPIQDLL